MLIRLLYSVCILAWIGTGVVLVQTFRPKTMHHDPIMEGVCSSPGLAEKFRDLRDTKVGADNNLSPLVVHAQAFATGINPPRPVSNAASTRDK